MLWTRMESSIERRRRQSIRLDMVLKSCALFQRDQAQRNLGLHELEPVFRKVTLENKRLRSLVRDLKFHHDPVGTFSFKLACWWPVITSLCDSIAVNGHNKATADRG